MPDSSWIDSGKTEAPKMMDKGLGWIKNNRETFIGGSITILAAAVFAVYFFAHYLALRDTAWKNLFIAQQTGYGGNMAQAQELLANIEKTYGNTPAAYYATLTKGDMLFTQGKFKEAGTEYAKLTAAPQNLAPIALYDLGKCKAAEGDLTGAQAQYTELLSKYPEHFISPEAHYSLAVAQELSGAKDLSKSTYEKIVLLYPDTSWAAQAKAKLAPPPAVPAKK